MTTTLDSVESAAKQFPVAHTKLFRRLSESVGCNVEVVEENGDVFYGLLDSFEMSRSYVILTLKTTKGLQFMNFHHVRYLRVASGRVSVPYRPSLDEPTELDLVGMEDSARQKPIFGSDP